jgi:hypothetical protein
MARVPDSVAVLSCKSNDSRFLHFDSPSANCLIPSGRIPFCGSLTSRRFSCAAKAFAQAAADPFSNRFLPQTTVRRFDVFPCAFDVSAFFAMALAMMVPPAGPIPLLLSLNRWTDWLVCRKLTMFSAHRPPKALSERSSSSNVGCSARASQIAESACGISLIRRPVKTSAKSAI